jgi:hypothetical protein
MPLDFVFDEQLRGLMWRAVQSHNKAGLHPIDVIRVGDVPDLPLGTKDPDILVWAERHGRIVVSQDESTMKTHLANHLRSGHDSPGVLLVRKGSRLKEVVFFLAAIAYASDAANWRDQATYIP